MAIFRLDRSGAGVAVGPLESAILEVLWNHGQTMEVPAVHQALIESGRAISYSAVKAVLNNLTGKGMLRKEQRGRTTAFEPLQGREEFDAAVISNVIGSLKRNYGAPVIAQLVDQLAVDDDTVREFERLIAERRKELGK